MLAIPCGMCCGCCCLPQELDRLQRVNDLVNERLAMAENAALQASAEAQQVREKICTAFCSLHCSCWRHAQMQKELVSCKGVLC